MTSPIIIALDANYERSINLAKSFDPKMCRLKVGSQLFTSIGPRVVEELCSLGYEVFLDLKFHDIPNTVFGAVKSSAELGVWMLNIHISGGSNMIKHAKRALDTYTNPPLIVGVTILTSLSDKDVDEIGITNLSNSVTNLSRLAKDNGLDGVVSSPREVADIKKHCGKDFITVTPGIRPASIDDDQTRILTPKEALDNGSDYLVIGRPVTESPNPLKSLEQILKDIEI